MSWIDEPGGEELLQDWELLFDDVSSAVESLDSSFSGHETAGVVGLARHLLAEVGAVLEMAGVLHLATDPAIDIDADVGLSRRLSEAEDLAHEDRTTSQDERRDAGVVFAAVVDAAIAASHEVDRAKCHVAVDVIESGQPTVGSLDDLVAATSRLVEWSRIYVEVAIGFHRATGWPPDSQLGGGSLVEMHDVDRVEQLRDDLAPMLGR